MKAGGEARRASPPPMEVSPHNSYEPVPVADRRAVAEGAETMAPEVVEICCGSAGLCAAFRAIGIPALGIDWSMNRHVQKSPWVSINMAEQ